MNELKEVPNYEAYTVDNLGNVFSKRLGKPLRTSDTKGYKSVYLYKEGVRRHLRVHRIVAAAFLGLDLNRPEHQVHHLDSVRDNNALSNLKITTNRINCMRKDNNKRNTSKYLGVSKTRNGKYSAHITIEGQNVHLGTFKDEYEAHLCYMTNSLNQINQENQK